MENKKFSKNVSPPGSLGSGTTWLFINSSKFVLTLFGALLYSSKNKTEFGLFNLSNSVEANLLTVPSSPGAIAPPKSVSSIPAALTSNKLSDDILEKFRASRPVKDADSISAEGYYLGKDGKCTNVDDIRYPGKCGLGAYSTPDIKYTENYAGKIKLNNEEYKWVLCGK